MKNLESYFERVLWDSRLSVLAAVVTSIASSMAVFYLATVDAVYMILHLIDYASPSLEAGRRSELRAETVTHVVEIIDTYLLATVLLIFALGLYELFISKIDDAARSETSSKVLFIENLDDLKARLVKVVLMILVVKFFEDALEINFRQPVDMLYFGAGIAFIGVALYLSHAGDARLCPHLSANDGIRPA